MCKGFLKYQKLNSKIKLSNNSSFVILIFAIWKFRKIGHSTFFSFQNLTSTRGFWRRSSSLVNNFFMQDEATPHRTKEVFGAIHRVYGTWVISLGYSKFANEGLEWPPYSLDLNPCDFLRWGYINPPASYPEYTRRNIYLKIWTFI